VSIVMPSLNRERQMEKAIASVLSQSHRPIELIVVDGFSSDGTVARLREYGETPKGVSLRWVSEHDRGTSEAMNKGIDMARGDVISFLNTDDFFVHAEVVANAVKALEDPAVDLTCANMLVTSTEGDQVLYGLASRPESMPYGMSINMPGAF